MNCNDLRKMAMGMARDASERKRVFEVAQLRWRMKAPKSHASIEAAMSDEYLAIIADWTARRGGGGK